MILCSCCCAPFATGAAVHTIEQTRTEMSWHQWLHSDHNMPRTLQQQQSYNCSTKVRVCSFISKGFFSVKVHGQYVCSIVRNGQPEGGCPNKGKVFSVQSLFSWFGSKQIQKLALANYPHDCSNELMVSWVDSCHLSPNEFNWTARSETRNYSFWAQLLLELFSPFVALSKSSYLAARKKALFARVASKPSIRCTQRGASKLHGSSLLVVADDASA